MTLTGFKGLLLFDVTSKKRVYLEKDANGGHSERMSLASQPKTNPLTKSEEIKTRQEILII